MIRASRRAFSVYGKGTKIYSWGKNEYSELGRDTTKNSPSIPFPIENFPSSSKILSVSAGQHHSMCCTVEGEVFTWGSNKFGCLGNGNDSEEATQNPTKVTGLQNVVEVTAGDCTSAALTTDGQLFTWGFPGSFAWGCGALGRSDKEDSKFPKKVNVGGSDDVRLKQVAIGAQHMLGLGLDGEVWVWGKGASGLMGDGKSLDRALPVPIVFLLDIHVVAKQVACGSNFNLVLDDKGQIYAWGGNERGQLGLGGGFNMDLESVPRHIEGLSNENIVHISAGQAHAAAVTESGELYMWGYSAWTEPQKMTALRGKKVVAASCGNNFTCAITDVGEVFSWGKSYLVARTGALGLGDNTRHAQPELVKLIPEPISQVSCGHKFVLALNGLPEVL